MRNEAFREGNSTILDWGVARLIADVVSLRYIATKMENHGSSRDTWYPAIKPSRCRTEERDSCCFWTPLANDLSYFIRSRSVRTSRSRCETPIYFSTPAKFHWLCTRRPGKAHSCRRSWARATREYIGCIPMHPVNRDDHLSEVK